jgi:hypothetical protein
LCKTFLLENVKGRDYSGHLAVEGRIILKCILNKYGAGLARAV